MEYRADLESKKGFVESVEIAYDHVGTALAAVVLSVFPWLHFVSQTDPYRIRVRCSSIWHEKLE
jgi:hypothetical protein